MFDGIENTAYEDKAMVDDIREASGFDLGEWEADFIESIEEVLDGGGSITDAQRETLARIWKRI